MKSNHIDSDFQRIIFSNGNGDDELLQEVTTAESELRSIQKEEMAFDEGNERLDEFCFFNQIIRTVQPDGVFAGNFELQPVHNSATTENLLKFVCLLSPKIMHKN